MVFDSKGVPLADVNGNAVYHPVYLIQYGLSEYSFYILSHDKGHLASALQIADFLVQQQDSKTGYWFYSFDFLHEYTGCLLKAPWASAMAQGQAISLLTRIFYVTKNQKYLKAAMKATQMLKVPISEGGLASDLCGHIVFEEYPTVPFSYTLNGFMFCALGLWDLTRVADDTAVEGLWNIASSTLRFMIPLYDGDLMSLYCLSHVTKGNVGRHWAEKYHPLHIKLLQCFESFIPNQTFEFYIERWAKMIGIKPKANIHNGLK